MIQRQKIIAALLGAGVASMLAACSTTTDSPSSQREKQVEAKASDPGISTGSRLPTKPSDRLVTGTDGQDMERYRPPNPLAK